MIIAGKSQSQKPKISPIGTRPSKAGYVSGAYEVGKITLKSFGYYKDIEPYLPDKYIDKYTYKPHKRIAGYLGQTFHSQKNKRYGFKTNYFKQKCGPRHRNCYQFNSSNQSRPN